MQMQLHQALLIRFLRLFADLFGSDDEVIPVMKELLEESERKRQIMHQALLLGMYYYTYLKKNPVG